MHKLIGSIGFAVLVALAIPALAQTGAAVVAKGPGVAGAVQKVKLTATITAIDAAKRKATLIGGAHNRRCQRMLAAPLKARGQP